MNRIEILGDFAGDKEKDIKRSLTMLYSTRAGECALDRDFGINWDYVDLPMPVAKARLTNEIYEKTFKYEEERAEIVSVTFDVGEEGKLIPKVVIRCLI